MKKITGRYFAFFLLIVAAVFAAGCKKEASAKEAPAVETEKQYSFSGPYAQERTPVLHKINPLELKLFAAPFSTSAHQEYLKDSLEFVDAPDGGIPTGSTAVVGSLGDYCLFYPIDSISSEEDLKKLPPGEPVPFATILPLGEEIKSGNKDLEDMFHFQDNINFFYKTTWNGKQGIVFGADLYGIGDSNETNRIHSLLYKSNGVFDNFYPAIGSYLLWKSIIKNLEQNGLAFESVSPGGYKLSADTPDDMISLYMEIHTSENKTTPIFVTTDLVAHANHLIFDHLLQYIEEYYFFSQLSALTDEYLKVIEAEKAALPQDVYTTSYLYFQTARALLALAPKKTKAQDNNNVRPVTVYQDVDTLAVLADFPQPVVKEIEKMNTAAGMAPSEIFGFPEDYSQYKVRGHYTKNGILGAYFRALLWYGRINFILGSEIEMDRELAARLAPVALYITDVTERSAELKALWRSLFDPITELIGASDDISFYELIPLWNTIKGSGFSQWYNDPEKRKTFVSSEYHTLRSPSISGSSVWFAPSDSDGGEVPLPPVGWRLFGQRYTMDSEIHYRVSSPRLMGRGMVRGLDILKVFGSKTADRLLRESDYPKIPNLEKTLNVLQQSLENVKDDYWLSTYYTNVLYQIKTLALFENGAGFYFTEQPGWNLKAMNSAHGAWAELRHDTILYTKQNYAERAGGSVDPTFRTRPLPEPVHYIEPNIPFWITSALGIQKLYSILEKYDYLDGGTAQVLARMFEICTRAARISELESNNQEVEREDLIWISKIANVLARLVLYFENGDVVDDVDSLRMALVADVFTNTETRLVLETAVGIPYRLYIPLNDKQGGKRIAVGYGFSYYEFTQPMSKRLNNEEWKTMVYKENRNIKQYLPFWMEGQVR